MILAQICDILTFIMLDVTKNTKLSDTTTSQPLREVNKFLLAYTLFDDTAEQAKDY